MLHAESGRSMVEMLGVLAIIGVLSVAGIAGYSMAMRKYRANEIISTASVLYMLAEAGNLSGNLTGAAYAEGDTVTLDQVNIKKPFNTINMTYTNKVVTVTGAGTDLCSTIQSTFGTDHDFTITCS